jgi:small subunit ribosomal protein S17
MAEIRYGGRKTRVGVVVSDRMSKTVVVAVGALKRHRLYKKIMRRVKRYKAHDEENACKVGDKVIIVETRPLSRDKRWRVAEILATAALPEEEKAIIEEEVAEELRELDEVMAAEAPSAEEEAPPTEEVVAEEELPPEEEVVAEEEQPPEEEAAQAEEEQPLPEEEAAQAGEEEPLPEEEAAQAEEGEQPQEEETQES